jgi:hypothetical protein
MCVQRRAISISYDRAPVLRGTTRRRRSPLWPVAGEQTGIECARAAAGRSEFIEGYRSAAPLRAVAVHPATPPSRA